MKIKSVWGTSLLLLCTVPLCSGAQVTSGSARSGDVLPSIECGPSECTLNYGPVVAGNSRVTPQALIPSPVDAGGPPGQRLKWVGPDNGACKTMGTGELGTRGVAPMYSPASPYEYIVATEIPVPLGSAHISATATVEPRLGAWAGAGEAAGAVAIAAQLQVRRYPSGAWVNLDSSYAYVINAFPADASPGMYQVLFGKATYEGFTSLADLPGGTGVPAAIDARLITFNVITNTVWKLGWNHVCKGQMLLTF